MQKASSLKVIETGLVERAMQQLLPKLNNRMGNVLFVGADLPEVAIRLVEQGLFVTVVEHSTERLEAFMAPIREAKLDRNVSVDARSYQGIEYQASSYNLVFCWGGIPQGMEPALFFKKVRRELKAGSTVYLKLPLKTPTPVPPQAMEQLARLAGKLPPAVGERVGSSWLALAMALSLPEAKSLSDYVDASANFLKYEEMVPLSLLAERILLLPSGHKLVTKLPAPALAWLLNMDGKMLAWKRAGEFASSALVSFSKSLEFGKVFRV